MYTFKTLDALYVQVEWSGEGRQSLFTTSVGTLTSDTLSGGSKGCMNQLYTTSKTSSIAGQLTVGCDDTSEWVGHAERMVRIGRTGQLPRGLARAQSQGHAHPLSPHTLAPAQAPPCSSGQHQQRDQVEATGKMQ